MTGFKPQTSDIRSDRSANWATTTALLMPVCVIYGSYQIASKARQLQIAAKRNIFSLDLYNYLMQVCVDYGQFQIASNARQLQIDANS